MINVNQDVAQSLARQCKKFVEHAIGEMAQELSRADAKDYHPEAYKKVAKARDWKGALADELYNDEGMIQDLAGDQLFNLMSQEGIPTDAKTYNAFGKVLAGHFGHIKGLDFSI